MMSSEYGMATDDITGRYYCTIRRTSPLVSWTSDELTRIVFQE